MKHFGYGCSWGLGGWLQVAQAIGFRPHDRYGVSITDTFAIAAVAGQLGWSSLGLPVSAAVTLRERFAARRALNGAVQGSGAPLPAPFDGEECFADTCRVSHDNGQSRRRRRIVPLYEGYALAPCAIATGTGNFRLLTVPRLDPETMRSSSTCLAAAQH